MTEFLGESVQYWAELKSRADALSVTGIMRELVEASAKVRYYEKHLAEMNEFRKAAEK